MMIREEEKAKVNSSEVRSLEKVLNKIEEAKSVFIDDFDLNAETILGRDLINRLSRVVVYDEELGKEVSLLNDVESRVIKTSKGKIIAPYCGILSSVHKSYIADPILRDEFESKVRNWFSSKTIELKQVLDHKETAKEVNKHLPKAYALASLALTFFHKRPNMRLYDVQKLTGIAISNGDIAELGTGEGKTLAGVLPTFLHALRGKGVHVVTANSYLAKRDFEEVSPIFYGLGLDVGFVPESFEDLARIEGIDPTMATYEQKNNLEKKLKIIKKKAYAADITYGAKSAFAFDYLRDSTITKREDMLQREENPGFALIDEVDDALIDDAQCPYVLGGNLPIYKNDMTLMELSNALNKPYDEVVKRIREFGIPVKNNEKLSFEKARHIAVSLYSLELIPDQLTYQKRAQRYFDSYVKKKLYVVRDGEFGLTAPELYEILTNDEKTVSISGDRNAENMLRGEIERIKRESAVIYFPDQKKYHVSDKCYEDFLTYCYAAFQVNSLVRENERSLLSDGNYVQGIDYFVDDKYNVRLTFDGVKRIVRDSNHPEFLKDYEHYMRLVSSDAAGMLHYFDQSLVANLLMSAPEDYVVHDGVVKVIKNSRIQDGSTYSNGLHQAIEFKENIRPDKMTQENQTIATITQKDFYGRYDMFSGMTGTSSKKVFSEVFGKNTVSIPRNAFYSFFSSRVKGLGRQSEKRPVGIDKKDTVFAAEKNDKINLIVNSILESHSIEPMQPVLLVVSNPEEMAELRIALNNAGIIHSALEATIDKSKEAEIIAKAGLPGAVTIATEMAGRGTDIKLGGDRNTIIDIATERHIKKIEAQRKISLSLTPPQRQQVRDSVENALMKYNGSKRFLWSEQEEKNSRNSLENIGLKVISSGYFKIDRIDRQLEGRTGRNGMAGVCERYACPEDFEYLGINEIDYGKSLREYFDSFLRMEDGSLELTKKAYNKLAEKIRFTQSNNEASISANIINTQELSKTATKLTEKFREKRRQLICGDVDIDIEIQEMFENTVDSLLMAYIVDGEISRDSLLTSLENCEFTVEIGALALEVKEVLGINMDVESVLAGGLNLLELRNALLQTVIEVHDEKREKDPAGQLERDKMALLVANDYAISNVPLILSLSGTQKNLTAMSMGMENMADYSATMEFCRGFKKMQLESSKVAVKQLMGTTLSVEERRELDDKKEELFGYRIPASDDDYLIEPISKENDGELVESFRKTSRPIEEQAERQKQKADKKAVKALEKNPSEDITKFYTNLSIRPLKFVASLNESYDGLVLVQGQPSLKSNVSKGK